VLAPTARLLARSTPDGLPLVGGLVRAGLTRAFGPPPFNPDRAPGDPGLFGCGAASWRVIGEPAAIVGGIRALLVQLLHPLAMAGVADHSRFREDALGRLQRTSAYVTTTAFGSTPEALAVARTVQRVHRRVRGVAPDGRAYRGDDPHLLAWIAVALTSSFLATDRAFALEPAPPAVADAFVAEQSRAAALLDPRVDLDRLARDPSAQRALRAGLLDLPMLAEGRLPLSVADLRATLARYRPELAVGAQGREALQFLLWPRIPGLLRTGYLPLAAAAVATLEPHERALLGAVAGRLAAAPLRWQGRFTVAALRLAVGTSPSQRAAERRCAPGAFL
jgi:uncharacterized protein (DUF2236 family)